MSSCVLKSLPGCASVLFTRCPQVRGKCTSLRICRTPCSHCLSDLYLYLFVERSTASLNTLAKCQMRAEAQLGENGTSLMPWCPCAFLQIISRQLGFRETLCAADWRMNTKNHLPNPPQAISKLWCYRPGLLCAEGISKKRKRR